MRIHTMKDKDKDKDKDNDNDNDNDTVRGQPGGPRAESHVIWDDSAAAFSRWLSSEPGAMDELVKTMTPVLS